MTLREMLNTLVLNIEDSVKQLAPDGRVKPSDLGLIAISSAAGFAVMLGCTREQLEENWREVLRMLDGDARADIQRKGMHLVGADGAPLKREPS